MVAVIWKLQSRKNRRINQLQDEGWLLKDEQHISWELDGTKEPGETEGILSKTIQAEYVFSFNKAENELPLSILVAQGGF